MKPVSPEWIKVHKSMLDSMREVALLVNAVDTHFAGKQMAMKAKEAQDGPFRKVLTTLRTDTMMVRKALEANKTDKNKAEVKLFQDMIDDMFSEGSEVWDTHRGIMDEKKTDSYTQEALKDWNSAAKSAKDKMVKKIVGLSKVPKLLAALSKTVQGVGAAQRAFLGHNAKFNQSYALLEKALDRVELESKKLAAVVKDTRSIARDMDRAAMAA